MATIISSKTSGVGGLSVTGDASGILQLASADGTTAVTIDASQNVGIGTASIGASGLTVYRANGVAISLNNASTGTTAGSGFQLQGGSGGDAYIWNFSNSFTAFATNNTERMRIDSSGNLLVGLTSPYAISGGGTNRITVGYNQNGRVQIAVTNSTNGASAGAALALGSYGADWIIENGALGKNSNSLTFTKDTTTAMTLDASGNLLVGCTASPPSAGGFTLYKSYSGTNSSAIEIGHATGGGTTDYYSVFYVGASIIGSIRQNGASTVQYNTSSDYRLKENVLPMVGALATVAQLKPVTYNWKIDGSDGQGFIAHELQAVVPDCVSGEKDAVDAEGNPVHQGIDTSFLVATLTAAIQEQQTLIEALTARLTALEAK